MSKFSEYLEQIKNEQNLSIVEIGNITGIDPATIYRWLNGQSLPKNWERVEMLLNSIHCLPYDKEELKRLYYEGIIGEKIILPFRKF